MIITLFEFLYRFSDYAFFCLFVALVCHVLFAMFGWLLPIVRMIRCLIGWWIG